MKTKQDFIFTRKTKQIDSNETYWDHVNVSNDLSNSEQKVNESVTANPDNLIDEPANKLWGGTTPKLARILIEEYMNDKGDFDILSPQENQVLRLYTAGQSLGQIALDLKISKSSAVMYLKRAGNKFRKLLKPLEGSL